MTLKLFVRIAVFVRDKGLCQHPKCKKEGGHPHHIKFKSNGGDDSLENLVSLCEEHHDLAHDSNKWRMYWEEYKKNNI